ncbi:MAG TPA: helix-turn-helix domain-containing protein, partial [Dermatophilaceae bacterium]
MNQTETDQMLALLARIVDLLESSVDMPARPADGAMDVAPGAALESLAYSAPDAAALLGVGRSTVYELIRTGELPAIKIRRTRRVTKAALEAYLAHRANP